MGRRHSGPRELHDADGFVVERDPVRPGGRLLRQGDMEASYVDLADQRHLEFDYLRRMRDLVEAARARRIIHVGGAGCALARALAAADPELRQEVVEVDATVLEIARAHLGLRRSPGLRVRVADGRAHLARRRDASADAVLIDAFVGARVPRHLVTVEAFADLARVLAPGGVTAVNVVDAPPWRQACAIAAGLREVLPHVAALGPGARRAGNMVVIAGVAPLPLERLRARAAADPSPARLLEPAVLAALGDGTAPWRD